MKKSEYSVIIVGSGLAGLYTAIKLAENINEEQKILLITKTVTEESNSKYAQGGIVSVMKENSSDSVKMHIEDTIKAGAGLSDRETVKIISENSEYVIKDLINLGVDFDRDENGNLKFTMEGAHSARRILHAGGDATGLYIERALVKKVQAIKNIDIMENAIIAEILTNSENKCCGIIAFDSLKKEHSIIYSSSVIFATGGAGQIYKNTTNPSVTTGDGYATAYKAGAVMQDMEFVQFHPTAFSAKTEKNMFLISEAVRGEGAKLKDISGKTFMEKYDSRLELASRDIVTRAIFNEMQTKNMPYVYLDATVIEKNKLNNRFPTITKICRINGIEPETEYIPVSPAAHYFMGGIKTTVCGKTSIPNLYAIGECSCTGLHGANRLASNSLLECVVAGYKLSEFLTKQSEKVKNQIIVEKDEKTDAIIKSYEKEIVDTAKDFDELKNLIKDIMWQKVGIIRNENTLKEALSDIEKLSKDFPYTDKCPSTEAYEVRNMLITAKLIIEFALNRKESRGGHYREDYPQQTNPPRHYAKKINEENYEEIYVK